MIIYYIIVINIRECIFYFCNANKLKFTQCNYISCEEGYGPRSLTIKNNKK